MFSLLLSLSLAPSLLAAPARAEFEGVLELSMSTPEASGTMTISVGKPGIRNEMTMTAKQAQLRMSMLFKKEKPDVAYMIHDADKQYLEVDLREAKRMQTAQKLTTKSLPPEKIREWPCHHALITEETGDETEVWTNSDIMDVGAFLRAVGQNAPANEDMMKALKKVGADGFIVKLVRRPKANPSAVTTLELVRAQKRSIPAATFEIPSGYTKRQAPAMGAPSGMRTLSPELQRQLTEQTKDLTPEQRQMIERAVREQMEKGSPGK